MYDNFEKDYWSLRHKLRKFARRMSVCDEDAEDAFQETMLNILSKYDKFKTYEAKEYWAFQLLRRNCAKFYSLSKSKGGNFIGWDGGSWTRPIRYTEEFTEDDGYTKLSDLMNEMCYTRPKSDENAEFIINNTPESRIPQILDWLSGSYDSSDNTSIYYTCKELAGKIKP